MRDSIISYLTLVCDISLENALKLDLKDANTSARLVSYWLDDFYIPAEYENYKKLHALSFEMFERQFKKEELVMLKEFNKLIYANLDNLDVPVPIEACKPIWEPLRDKAKNTLEVLQANNKDFPQKHV